MADPLPWRRLRWSVVLLGALALSLMHAAGAAADDVVSARPGAGAPGQSREAQVDLAVAAARAEGRRVEVAGLRTERQRQFANPDGTVTAEITSTRSSFRGRDGAWRQIDVTAVAGPDGSYRPAANDVDVHLPARASGQVRLPLVSGPLGVTYPGADAVDGSVSGSTVTYPAAFDGVTLSHQLLVDGLQETVTLPSAAASGTYQSELSLPSGVRVRQVGAGVELVDAGGAVVATVGGGYARDSLSGPTGPAETLVSVRVVSQSAGVATLSTSVDRRWITDLARVFPVAINALYYRNTADGGGMDTWVESDSSAPQAASPELRVGSGFGPSGNGIARTLIKFTLTDIPDNVMVTEAHIGIHDFAFSGGGCNPVFLTGLSSGFAASTVWTNQPGPDAYGLVSTTSFDPCATGWKTLDVTSLATRWFDWGQPNFGFRLQNFESPTAGWVKFNSGETGGSSAPALFVTYEPRPALPVAQFAPTIAMQASPLPGASLGTLEFAYVDNIGRVVHGHATDPNSPNTSMQFTVISGSEAFTGSPAMVEQADGRLQVVAHNTDSNVWHAGLTTKDPLVWAPFTNVGGTTASRPAMVRASDGRLVVAAVGSDGRLWVIQQTAANGAFGPWRALGPAGAVVSPPVLAPVGTGVRVFALDASGTIQTAVYSLTATLSAWTSLGGSGFTAPPAVVMLPGDRARVFARATDGTIHTQQQDMFGGFPGGWDPVGMFASAGPPAALLSPATGEIELVARGADNAIYNTGETIQGSAVWRDWEQKSFEGDLAATEPTVVSFRHSGGDTWAFTFRNSDNVIRLYTAQTGSGLHSGGGPAFTPVSLPTPTK